MSIFFYVDDVIPLCTISNSSYVACCGEQDAKCFASSGEALIVDNLSAKATSRGQIMQNCAVFTLGSPFLVIIKRG